MIEKLKKKTREIIYAKNTVTEPKKTLVLTIVTAVCVTALSGVVYFFTKDHKYILIAVIAMVPLIIYAIFSFFKEKRHDRSSERDKQEFLSGAKYRKKEWQTAYYQYKETHTFEAISKKGMKHDLKKRFHKKDFGYIRLGFLLASGSVLILFIHDRELKDKAVAIFGILIGGAVFSIGARSLISGPVQSFFKQQSNLAVIESSYVKGKMLSFRDNGINLGSSYTVLYNYSRIYAIENSRIQDMTRKMVRVKQYEDSLYSGQEYRYYICLIYSDADDNTNTLSIRLDEFQCEMMIAEFNRRFYPDRKYDSTTLEITENSVSV